MLLSAPCGRICARSPRLDGDQADAVCPPRRGPAGAEAQLEALAKQLERTHPGGAGSLHEGLGETLTVLRLGVSPPLARTLPSTHSIKSMISIARNHSMNVKHWQNSNMTLRWCAAGIEASKQFRRDDGHLHLPALRVALDEHVAAQTVGAVRQDDNLIAA